MLDPSRLNFLMLTVEPIVTNDNTLQALPPLTLARIETAEPNCAKSYVDMLLPLLNAHRRLNELPNGTHLSTEQLLPARNVDLSDSDEAKFVLPTTLK
jgi:hypothetical protein